MIVFIFIYTKKMINRLPRLKRYTFQKPKKKKKKSCFNSISIFNLKQILFSFFNKKFNFYIKFKNFHFCFDKIVVVFENEFRLFKIE